jgi:hypothetical protein
MRLLGTILPVVIAASLVGPATALAQSNPQPTLKFSPASVKSGGKVTVTGKKWSMGEIDCNTTITLSATDASGQATKLPTLHLRKPSQTRFSKRIAVKLPAGTYTVTASQDCDAEEGGDAVTSTAQAQLTVQ